MGLVDDTLCIGLNRTQMCHTNAQVVKPSDLQSMLEHSLPGTLCLQLDVFAVALPDESVSFGFWFALHPVTKQYETACKRVDLTANPIL